MVFNLVLKPGACQVSINVNIYSVMWVHLPGSPWAHVSQLGIYTSLLTISVSTQVVYPQMNVLTVLCLCLGTGISGCGQDYYPRRWYERLLLAGAVQLFPPQASNISALVILRYNLGNSLACICLFGNKYVHFKTAYWNWQ